MVERERSLAFPGYQFTRWTDIIPQKPSVSNGVILEIGAGSTPMYMVSEAILGKIRGGRAYIDIDMDREALWQANRDKFGIAAEGDLEALPVRDGVADEVWISNLFGSIEWLFMDKAAVFKELHRVLKKDGLIHIVETYTPSVGLSNKNYKLFGLEEVSSFQGEEAWQFIADNGITTLVSHHFKSNRKGSIASKPSRAFILTLRKI